MCDSFQTNFRKCSQHSLSIVSYLIAAFLVTVSCLGQDKPERSLIYPPAPEPQTLGPGDQIQVKALHAPELGERPVRVDSEGFIMLTGLGRIRAGTRTTEQLANDVRERLSKVIRDPEVSIDIVELHSQPVSVLGAVKTPGVYQIVGKKRLTEVLALAGGLDPEAGGRIQITRSLGDGEPGQAEKFTVVEIRVDELMGGRWEKNLVMHSEDVITVPRAKLVYVIGQVRKSGGFVLRERQDMSVLQALSLAEGLLPTAGAANAKILRQDEPLGPRKEISVNIKSVLAGKSPDQPLLPDDVLFIPNSVAKAVALRSLEAVIQMGTGLVVWRQF